ncbi:MAG: hypothetical protein HKN82_12480 [Akkermansiaceae bacterium]|nr:hypothetical protein [Akkermansiaceae bacterium]NNM28556.1 hypothetical protein [Akkermansiaceae bacterium]
MHTLRRILFALAALCLVDGHLFVGQSVAWLTMIGDRAPQMGFTAAVADSLSGESPCDVCRAIRDERQEKRQEAPLPDSRPELKFAPVVFSERVAVPDAPPASGPPAAAVPAIWRSWAAEVPTPPPRLG